jgi:hypothetical protein
MIQSSSIALTEYVAEIIWSRKYELIFCDRLATISEFHVGVAFIAIFTFLNMGTNRCNMRCQLSFLFSIK